MPVFTTSQGRPVTHCHRGQPPCPNQEIKQTRIDKIRDFIRLHHPHAVETAGPTNLYNCVGFALANSHGWFNDHQPFFTDDYVEASFDSPAAGDAVRYNTSHGAFAHVAVVTEVSGGQITRLRSKWGGMSELLHAIDDVPEGYGSPAALLRPRPGVTPFVHLTLEIGAEEAEEPAEVAHAAALEGGEQMPEFASTDEVIRWALDRILDPDVNVRVALASTPEAARRIIEELPGVKELIEVGPEAAPEVLNLLKRAEEEDEPELAGIALYLLQRIPTEEAMRPLALAYKAGRYTGLNTYLAADALLTSTEAEVVNENPLTTALREAEKLIGTE